MICLGLRSMLNLLRNNHPSDRTLVLDSRKDSDRHAFWNLSWTAPPWLYPSIQHASMTVNPKGALRAHRLFPFHRDRVYCRSAQHGLGSRHLFPGAPLLLWPCLLQYVNEDFTKLVEAVHTELPLGNSILNASSLLGIGDF